MEICPFLTSVCQTNTYLIIDGSVAVVIDPGGSADRLIDHAAQSGAKISHILITHAHFDHIGGVAELKIKCGATIYVPKADYETAGLNSQFCELDACDTFSADVLLDTDGEVLSLIGHEFKVIATPGHTPGGVCYVLDGKYIFSGDTLFNMSVGRTDFQFCSHTDLMKSVNKLFALDGDYTVYPGHGPKSTLDNERKFNPYADRH